MSRHTITFTDINGDGTSVWSVTTFRAGVKDDPGLRGGCPRPT